MGEDYSDAFDAELAEAMKDPEYAEAYQRAQERADRSIQTLCSEGRCVVFTDPLDPDYEGGWGPVNCRCQGTPSLRERAHRVVARWRRWLTP